MDVQIVVFKLAQVGEHAGWLHECVGQSIALGGVKVLYNFVVWRDGMCWVNQLP